MVLHRGRGGPGLPPARPLEGTAPTRWGLTFTAPDEKGVRREVVAEFTWGLLQRIAVR